MNVKDASDKSYFFDGIASTFAGIVQYATGSDLKDACTRLMDPSLPNDYARLARFVANARDRCMTNYQDFVNYYSGSLVEGEGKQAGKVLELYPFGMT